MVVMLAVCSMVTVMIVVMIVVVIVVVIVLCGEAGINLTFDDVLSVGVIVIMNDDCVGTAVRDRRK